MDYYFHNSIIIYIRFIFRLICLTEIYNLRVAIGFAIIIIILYRFNYLSQYKLLH